MARTKQTARKNDQEGSTSDAHRVQRAIAAGNATSRARLLGLQRSWLAYCAQQAMEEEQEQQEEHEQQEQQPEEVLCQQEDQQQGEQQEEEEQQQQGEEQEQEEPQVQGQPQPDAREPQGEASNPSDQNIFGDLGNIMNFGMYGQAAPLVAMRTNIFNVPDQVQPPWAAEQARLRALEEEQEIQRRVLEHNQREQARLAEEENLRFAQQLEQELERRQPIKLRKKECARRRKRSPVRLVPVVVEENPQQQQQAPVQENEEEAERRQNKRVKFRNDAPAWERRAPPPPPPRVKRKYRHRPGVTALKEIRKYQKSCELLIAKAPFMRLVKEVMQLFTDRVNRIQAAAVGALQEAAEDILTSLFQDSVLCHIHAKRVTLKTVDMALAMRLRQENSFRK